MFAFPNIYTFYGSYLCKLYEMLLHVKNKIAFSFQLHHVSRYTVPLYDTVFNQLPEVTTIRPVTCIIMLINFIYNILNMIKNFMFKHLFILMRSDPANEVFQNIDNF